MFPYLNESGTLGSDPYRNSNLFSGYNLDERGDDLNDGDADEDAEAAFEVLREQCNLESGLIESHGEDKLLNQWMSGVLGI